MSNDETYYDPYDPAQYSPEQWAMNSYYLEDAGATPSGYYNTQGLPMPDYMNMAPMGFQPQLDPLMQQYWASAFQYPVNSRGNPEFYDLDTQVKFQNAMQDRQQSLFNYGNSYLSGMGAFSPEAFEPIVSEKQLDFPKTGTLQVQAQMGGYQGQLARLIMAGMSPAQAAATIQDAVENQSDNVTDDERAELMMGLPRTMAPNALPGDEPVFDWNAIQKEAASMAAPYYEEQGIKQRALDPASGVIERNGKYFQTTETPSPMEDWRIKQGLPRLDAQYDRAYMEEMSPEIAGLGQLADQSFAQYQMMKQLEAANDSERRRQAGLESQFRSADQAAMDRFSRDVQGGMSQYARDINRDFLVTPEYGGGQYIGDPTVEPMLGQRTESQRARDAQLAEALGRYGSGNDPLAPVTGTNRAAGRVTATPEEAKRALADYFLATGSEPMTSIEGRPGEVRVGGAGRSGSGRTEYIQTQAGPGELNRLGFRGPGPGREITRVDYEYGDALNPTLPELPTLSAWSLGEDEMSPAELALQIAERTPFLRRKVETARRGAEQTGKARPKKIGGKQADQARTLIQRGLANRSAFELARSMVPALAMQRAGRTPAMDAIMQRSQPMYTTGALGQQNMPWSYPRG